MRRLAHSAAWMRARSTNVLRRPIAISAVGTVAAGLVLAALMLVPGRAHRAASAVMAEIPERPDSLPSIRIRNQALLQLATADSIMRVVRLEAAEPLPVVMDTLPRYLIARRDSLRNTLAAFTALISRAQNAPLPSSYRALGESSWMAGIPEVRVLLDSLSEIERDRESFGAVSGVDPMYLALTARVNAVGRTIVGLAQNRRAALRGELLPLLPPPAPPRRTVTVDTLRILEGKAVAEGYILGADEELEGIRARNREIDALERRARELRNVGASLSATLGAAIIVGLAVGFAVLLLFEMREPRVADIRDAEQTAHARVVAVARPIDVLPERDRRKADITVPEVIDPYADHYRLLHLRLTAREAPVRAVTITGAEPEIAAVVAVNLAAYEVREARSAAVVDADPVSSGVARALDISADPGLTDLLFSGDLTWPDVVEYVNVGRDQVLAVLPSGRRVGRVPPQRAAAIRTDLARLSARHDLIVFTAPPEQTHRGGSSLLLSSDVVVCVQLGQTRIRALKSIVQRLRDDGMTIHGLLIWGAEAPRLRPARRSAPHARPGAPAAV